MDECQFYTGSHTGQEIDDAIAAAKKLSETTGLVKGDGRGGVTPCVPGEDYGFPILTGSGAPDGETAASLGQFYIDTSATVPPYLYVNVGYNNDNGFLWQSTMGLSALDPTAQGSFRLNPVAGEAKGWFSTAMGISCEAEGMYAFAEGFGAKAKAKKSHAEGDYTVASSEGQHVQGKYNVEDTEGKYAHIVGNGTANERSNAHTVDWNGNAWFAGKVFVGGTGADDPEAVELGTGGGGADLLNENGVIKQEHLPDGYPYYEVNEGYILPETTITLMSENGEAPLTEALVFFEGQTYRVNWNGTDYECVCTKLAMDTDVDGIVDTYLGLAIGDVGLMTGGNSTGEPFVIAVFSPEYAAQVGVPAMVQILDGSTSVTLSIIGIAEKKTAIASKYLPDGYPYEERIEGVLLSETEVANMSAVPLQMDSLIVGETYIVTVGGVEYETTCKIATADNISGKCLGNLGALGYTDTGEPFVIFPSSDGEGASVLYDANGRQTFEISGPSIVIHPMAEKFMPGAEEKDVLTYLVDIDGAGEINPTFDELVTAIRAGKAISYRSLGASWAREYPFLKMDTAAENPYIVFQHVVLEENTATATVKQFTLYQDGTSNHIEFQWPSA